MADNDSTLEGTAALTLAPPVAAHYVLKTAGKWLDATTSAMYLIGAAAAALYLCDESRRSKTFTRLSRIGEVFVAALEPILESQEAALSQLRQAVYRPTAPTTLKQQVASVLARSRDARTAEEIRNDIDSSLLPSGVPSGQAGADGPLPRL